MKFLNIKITIQLIFLMGMGFPILSMERLRPTQTTVIVDQEEFDQILFGKKDSEDFLKTKIFTDKNMNQECCMDSNMNMNQEYSINPDIFLKPDGFIDPNINLEDCIDSNMNMKPEYCMDFNMNMKSEYCINPTIFLQPDGFIDPNINPEDIQMNMDRGSFKY